MFKLFRRSKADKTDRSDPTSSATADAKKKTSSRSTKETAAEKPKLSTTLGNSLLLRGSATSGAGASSTSNDKNKLVRGRQEDHQAFKLQRKHVDQTKPSGADSKKFKGLLAVAADSADQRRENATSHSNQKRYAKELSSRNEIADQTRSDRTSPCRNNQNDRSRSDLIDHNDKSKSNDRRRLHLLQSSNQCQQAKQKQKQLSVPVASNRGGQEEPTAPTTSFNPINKSREFFYEIMGKNRNRNRNRNRNKDTKPYNRVGLDSVTNTDGSEPVREKVSVGQRNESNEKAAQFQEQLIEKQLECVTMPDKIDDEAKLHDEIISVPVESKLLAGYIETVSDGDEAENANSDENSENSENFGYRITKSKNRTNLVMKYEGKDDREERIENSAANGNCEPDEDYEVRDDDDAVVKVETYSAVRADAHGDVSANQCENRLYDGDEESDQSSSSNCGNSTEDNSTTGKCGAEFPEEDSSINVIGERNLQHVDCSRSENDPQQHELHEADPSRNGEQNVALAWSKLFLNDRISATAEWPSLVIADETRDSVDGRLEIDRNDLANQQTSITQSIGPIACDSANQQLRQDFDDTVNMGQDNSKSASDRHRSRTTSDHEHSNLVIPKITVADYSDKNTKERKGSGVAGDSSGANSATDNDVFYDTEAFDLETSSATQTNPSVIESINDNDQEFSACESGEDRVIIEDDPDDQTSDNCAFNSFPGIPVTVVDSSDIYRDNNPDSASNIHCHSDPGDNIILSNTSSSSTISEGKHELDSGIEILDDSRIGGAATTASGVQFLHISRDSEAFVRGSSTDCDENFLLQSDSEDHDYHHHRQHHEHQRQAHYSGGGDKKDKAIVIDSISLPDVVVESTGSGMGNSGSVKTVEHIDDHGNSPRLQHHHGGTIFVTDHNDNEKRDLVNQEARYSAQLEEAQKIILSTQTKINELQAKIDSLEKELSFKSWNVDRLQGELQAANKEDACVRRRLNILQEELMDLKQKYSEKEYELTRRYDDLKTKHSELVDNYRHTQNLANALQTQLAITQSDIEQIRKDKVKMCEEKDAELRNLQEALKQSHEKHKELEQKWQKEFEVLRNQNADREEQLMLDLEWKMRTLQKSCKEKIEVAKKEKDEALEKANEISTRANEQIERVSHLIPLEAEIKQLRGLTDEQRESLVSMSEQMAELRSELESANRQVEEEIKNVRKIRMQCDNALSDKDRHMIQQIEEARGTVAVEWETRLLEEMTRLKNELEMVHGEDRREALDKLQQEHIEEIKVLTCRYDANEEELRSEIEQLREALRQKCNQYDNLKQKTDAALLETRLHLERADVEYQVAMNREIEKREMLTDQLQAEFKKEKLEMEEKFRERLNQVKDEFARELANAAEDMSQKHRKQLEQQWQKLIAEKEEALQTMENRHRVRLEEAENRIKELEINHSRDFKEMKNNFEIERTTLETRDLQNSQEIEQLHRKCRCLTNLFEEMRMRYERREPRPEDLREIAELRERCESQERDLYALTERLREMQMEREDENAVVARNGGGGGDKAKTSGRKPPPKTIPTNCDVIYEENEERESPHKESSGIIDAIDASDDDEDDDDDEEETDEDEEEVAENGRTAVARVNGRNDADKNEVSQQDASVIAVQS